MSAMDASYKYATGEEQGKGSEHETTHQKFREVREFEPRWDIRDDERGLLGVFHELALERVQDVTELAQAMRLDFGDVLQREDVSEDTRQGSLDDRPESLIVATFG